MRLKALDLHLQSSKHGIIIPLRKHGIANCACASVHQHARSLHEHSVHAGQLMSSPMTQEWLRDKLTQIDTKMAECKMLHLGAATPMKQA